MKKKLVNVVVKRSRWSRRANDNALYVPSSKRMCCLGFCARAAGYEISEINDVSAPIGLAVSGIANRWNQAFGSASSRILDEMMDINDNPKEWPAEIAEPALTKLAKKIGINLSFVD